MFAQEELLCLLRMTYYICTKGPVMLPQNDFFISHAERLLFSISTAFFR